MKLYFKYFIFSSLLTVLLVWICLFHLSAFSYLLIVVSYFGLLIMAALFFALRLAFMISRQSFVYIFTATANFGYGLSAVFIYFTSKGNKEIPELMMLNLLCGVILLVDAFLLKRKPYEQAPIS